MTTTRYWRAWLIALCAIGLTLGALTLPQVAQAAAATTNALGFTYTGSWSGGASEMYSTANGSVAKINFSTSTNGGTIALNSVKASDNGIESVKVDNLAAVNVDLYSATYGAQTVYTSPVLAPGNHTLTVTQTGTKNASSADYSASVVGATDSNGAFGGPGYTAPPATNTAPTSAFSENTLTVAFNGSASSDPDGTVASYAWNFGDGGTATTVSPSHTYATPGTYTVKLTVTDNGGASTVSTQQVTVSSSSVSQAGTTSSPPANTASTASETVTAGSTADAANVHWGLTMGTDGANGVILSRDGTDSTGAGPWSSTPQTGTSGDFTFTHLVSGTTYNLKVQPVNGTTPVGTSKTVQFTPGTAGGGGTTPPPTCTGGASGACTISSLTMPARGWFSGGAGEGFDPPSTAGAAWRQNPIDEVSTWISGNGNGDFWSGGVTQTGGNTVTGVLDVAIGGPTDYAAAAGGSMDSQVTALFTKLRQERTVGGVLRPTIIRPFHEMNGNWFSWSVTSANLANFHATAQRWHNILMATFPEAIWEFSPNGDSSPGVPAMTSLYSAADGWNMVGVDRYNAFGDDVGNGHLTWAAGSTQGTDAEPSGVQRWLNFAAARGVPLGFPEYANDDKAADNGGNDATWANNFYPWLQSHAGKGAGQVLYDGYFNIAPSGDGNFAVYQNGADNPTNSATAASYKAFFATLPD